MAVEQNDEDPNGKKRKAAHHVSSQDNQLFPPLESPATKVSTLVHRAPSPDGSPDAKRARMGSVKHYGSGSHSVAQRLKESTLKFQEINKSGPSNELANFKSPYPVFREKRELTEGQKATVRLISQYLKDLGLRDSVDTIVEETGCKIEHSHAARLRRAVLSGNWDEALAILDRSAVYIGKRNYDATYQELIIQKCLDFISTGEVVRAVRLLKTTMPRYRRNAEIQQLHRLVLMGDNELEQSPVIRNFRSMDYRKKVCKNIESLLPTSFMLPQARLENILEQSRSYQVESCPLHLTKQDGKGVCGSESADSILVDHVCDSSTSIHNAQVIDEDKWEVFCLEFSPNGKMLATASRSNSIRIYKTNKKTLLLQCIAEFSHRRNSPMVTGMSWSSDSRFLAVAGGNQHPFDICVFDVETGRTHRTLKKVNNIDFTTCAFAWGGYMLAVADENGHFQVHDVTEPYDKESVPKYCWEGYRIKQLKGLREPNTILGLDTHNRIRRYQWRPGCYSDWTLLSETSTILSFAVHKTERYILVSTEVNMHLWDIQERTLVRSFVCAFNMNTIVDPTFGGLDHEFVATGTPSGRIMIYNINNTFPIFELKSHTDCVNAVAWHPKAAGLFVSVSKDETVRVWHMGCQQKACSQYLCDDAKALDAIPKTKGRSKKETHKRRKGGKKRKAIEREDRRKSKAISEKDVPLISDEMPKRKRRKTKKDKHSKQASGQVDAPMNGSKTSKCTSESMDVDEPTNSRSEEGTSKPTISENASTRSARNGSAKPSN